MKKHNTWTVYIISSTNGNLYTGITKDLNRRFSEHNNHKRGAKFFHLSKPEKILYKQSYKDRSDASKREYQIKKMSRQEKLNLIQDSINEHIITK